VVLVQAISKISYGGLSNFIVSISLFVYKYGIKGLLQNQIYLGALIVLVTFFFTSGFWVRYYNKKDKNASF
jgi:hypothetical protein